MRECNLPQCRAEVLPLLYAMGRAIAEGHDLQRTSELLLQILREHLGVPHGTFALHHRRTGAVVVHKSLGTDRPAPDQGIALGVLESGQPVIAPRIPSPGSGQAPAEDSLLCIPILRHGAVLGTIHLEKPYPSLEALLKDVELVTFIATVMAQAAELYLLENEEKNYWQSENRRLQNALSACFQPENIIGTSPAMRKVYGLIEKVAKSGIKVLILGESGTGKELVAGALHRHGSRADGPFVRFNCAALPESLVESELFGHERGSFTGAETLRQGRFEEADGGTIFLDEVGELSLAMQAKLLRVLQERCFERVGGNQTIRVDIRILAATNRDLSQMVQEGRFREDLYYRLNMFPIVIPPLRERGSDIIAIAEHFVRKYAKENGRTVQALSPTAMQLLMSYSWPGNVRELENVIERAVILCEGEVIHGYGLPPEIQEAAGSESRDTCGVGSKVEAAEVELIVDALRRCRGRVTDAARELGMTRRVLGLRLKKYGIDPQAFKDAPPVPA